MSLTGKATADQLLRGKINGLETLKGYSAYEIALIHGFEGTEEEWLDSLNGGLITVDKQLYRSGHAADAKVTGEKIAELATKISDTEDYLSDRIDTEKAERQAEIAVERARITNLATLEEGSTTGDAELMDIRVGIDGTRYPTAGEAVRGQVRPLDTEVFGTTGAPVLTWEKGSVVHGTNGGVYIDSTTAIRTQGFIKLPVGATVRIASENVKYRVHFFTEENVISHIDGQSMSSYYHTESWVMDADHADYFCAFQMAWADGTDNTDIEGLSNELILENAGTVVVGLKTRMQKAEQEIDVIKSDVLSNNTAIRELDAKISTIRTNESIILEATAEQMISGDVMTVAQRLDIKKNCVQEFYADITAFDSVTVGHGQNKYMGSYVTVTETDVTMYMHNGSTAVVQKTASHGLTISNFIHIILENDDKCKLKATITTASGVYVFEAEGYFACNGDIFASTTSTLTNCVCKWIPKDLMLDIFLFGDSYTALGDSTKFTTQLVNMGFADKMLMNGYGGASSTSAITAFRNLVALKKPKYIVWALGMNDGDSTTAINSNWKTYYNEVDTWCAENNVELILVTIPNTPTVTNTFKNEYIRATGHRYIDFAKAVGAEETGSAWYDGMLSSDNVHPANLGAKALAARFILDFPECI